MKKLISIDSGQRVKVLSRPSIVNKSPYLADVLFEDGSVCMAHTPSLGVGGLVDKNAYVWVTPIDGKNTKRVSRWVVYLAEDRSGNYLGVLPLSANVIAIESLKRNYIKALAGLTEIKAETKINNSRFDIVARVQESNKIIIEVKSVNGSNELGRTYTPAEVRQRHNSGFRSEPCIAFFPEGSRTGKKGNTVSPRAVRHLEELSRIKKANPSDRCVMLYVVQRDGCDGFAINSRDPVYHNAFIAALASGVEMIAISVRWSPKGCVYRNELPFMHT